MKIYITAPENPRMNFFFPDHLMEKLRSFGDVFRNPYGRKITREELAEELNGQAVVGKINVDEEGDLARQFRVNSIPCLIVFENGQEVRRSVGAQGKDALKKLALG